MGVGSGECLSVDTTKERDVDYQDARPSSFLSAPELRFTL